MPEFICGTKGKLYLNNDLIGQVHIGKTNQRLIHRMSRKYARNLMSPRKQYMRDCRVLSHKEHRKQIDTRRLKRYVLKILPAAEEYFVAMQLRDTLVEEGICPSKIESFENGSVKVWYSKPLFSLGRRIR